MITDPHDSRTPSGLGRRLRLMSTAVFASMTIGCAQVPMEQRQPLPAAQVSRPDFLLIVADDLGYSDIGAFGGEINTPNLDRLAGDGLRLTNMHVAPTCSPTRAMLLTGVDAHRVGLGAMAEMPIPERSAGHEGYLLRNAATVAERLSDAGYATAMTGKWHLGMTPEQWPSARGFQQSFALLNGAANHFGMDRTPSGDKTVFTATYVEGTAIAQYPKGRYSSDVFADRMIDFIGSVPADKPLFSYLAFTAPHWPLQAPEENIERYAGRYDDGPEAIRAERLARMKSMGLIDEDTRPHPILGNSGWDRLSAEEKAASSRKMEIYAAMVEHMDRAIGQVLAALEAKGRLQNTIVIFVSDNGPDGLPQQAMMSLVGAESADALGIDNRLENLGSGRSFTSYGPIWAQVSSAPFNRMKGYTTEGGTRVPVIVSGPGIANGMNDALLHATDLLPTLLEWAGASTAKQTSDAAPLLAPTGHSMKPVLTGAAQKVRQPDEALGFEFYGGGALWRGDWKLTRLPPKSPLSQLGEEAPAWKLYDLSQDPGETSNLATQNPALVETMARDWADYVARNNVADMTASAASD